MQEDRYVNSHRDEEGSRLKREERNGVRDDVGEKEKKKKTD